MFNFDKDAVTERLPGKFTVAITSKCNFRCPTCLYLLNDKNHFNDKGFMGFHDYEKIILKFKDNVKMLTLTGGEPTMHPQLEEFIDFANSYGISVGFPTNGSLIKKNINAFRKANGTRISLDACDYATFRQNRGGGQKVWADILEGMELLQANEITFDISFLITKTNVTEMQKMLEFTAKVGASLVNFHSFNPHTYSTEDVLLQSDVEVTSILSDIMEKNDYPYDIVLPYLFNEKSPYFKKKICSYPWVQASINEVGDVGYCCHMAHESTIGNVFSGYDFNSNKMQKWRKALLENKLTKDCYFCHRRFLGDYAQFFKSEKQWVTPTQE